MNYLRIWICVTRTMDVSACVVGKLNFIRWFMYENWSLQIQWCDICFISCVPNFFFVWMSTIVLKPICSICIYMLARKRRKENFSINCKMNGGMCKIEYCCERAWEDKMKRERESSLTSYGVRRQQVQGYSLQKATYTHFHVYVLCTLVPFISSPVIHTNIIPFVALSNCI